MSVFFVQTLVAALLVVVLLWYGYAPIQRCLRQSPTDTWKLYLADHLALVTELREQLGKASVEIEECGSREASWQRRARFLDEKLSWQAREHAHKVGNLENRVRWYEGLARERTGVLGGLREDLAFLRQENAGLRQELSLANKKLESRRSELTPRPVSQAGKEPTAPSQQTGELTGGSMVGLGARRLPSDAPASKAEDSSLQKELKSVNKELRSAQEAVRVSRSVEAEARGEAQRYKAALQSKEQQLAELNGRLETLVPAGQALEARCSELALSEGQLRNQVEWLQSALGRVESDNAALKAEGNRLFDQLMSEGQALYQRAQELEEQNRLLTLRLEAQGAPLPPPPQQPQAQQTRSAPPPPPTPAHQGATPAPSTSVSQRPASQLSLPAFNAEALLSSSPPVAPVARAAPAVKPLKHAHMKGEELVKWMRSLKGSIKHVYVDWIVERRLPVEKPMYPHFARELQDLLEAWPTLIATDRANLKKAYMDTGFAESLGLLLHHPWDNKKDAGEWLGVIYQIHRASAQIGWTPFPKDPRA